MTADIAVTSKVLPVSIMRMGMATVAKVMMERYK
jgi:hypothetical protein